MCEFAICLDISVGSKRVTIIVIGLFKININNKVPITLKHKCIKAALLAFLFVPILDNKDVVQLPILSPYKIGNAPCNGIRPWEANAINIPIDALELCKQVVIKNPAINANIGWFAILANILLTNGYSDNGATASFINLIPINNIAKPISISDIFLRVGLDFNPIMYKTIPIPRAIDDNILTSKDTNWAVTVVPMFAPIIIPIAW